MDHFTLQRPSTFVGRRCLCCYKNKLERLVAFLRYDSMNGRRGDAKREGRLCALFSSCRQQCKRWCERELVMKTAFQSIARFYLIRFADAESGSATSARCTREPHMQDEAAVLASM